MNTFALFRCLTFVCLLAAFGISNASALAQEKILILRSSNQAFLEIEDGLKQELSTDFSISSHTIQSDHDVAHLLENITVASPQLIIAMDEKAIQDMKKLYQQGDGSLKDIPCIAMGLNLAQNIAGQDQMCGISYEVSPYQIVTSFRYIAQKQIKSIMVAYRASVHEALIQRARENLNKEGIELIPFNVEKKSSRQRDIEKIIRYQLPAKVRKDNPDAFLVIPDSKIITQNTFNSTWRAISNHRIPFISGVQHFASTQLKFCVYACFPNHLALGRQLGQLANEILIDDISPAEIGIESIISTNKLVNLDKSSQHRLVLHQQRLKDVEVIR